MLVAVVGEYLGGKGGVGVALVSSQRTADAERTRGLAITITFLAGACYLLVTDPDAPTNRHVILEALGTTLGHAAIGFVVGTIAALVSAVALRLIPGAALFVLPVAIAAQSVPIVALLPLALLSLALLVLGRGAVLAVVAAER